MPLQSIPAALMALLCAYVGFVSALKAWRARDAQQGYLAFMSAALALYDLFTAGLYGARDGAEAAGWQRLQFTSLALVAVGIAWFLAALVDFRSRALRWGLAAGFAAIALLGLVAPPAWTLAAHGAAERHLRLGPLSLTWFEAAPGPVYLLQYAAMTLLVVAGAWFLVREYRADERRLPGSFAAALALFFFAALNDTIAGAGFLPSPYLLEYAGALLAAAASWYLDRRLIERAGELAALNRRLEEKAKERTMEFFFSELGRGLSVETIREATAAGVTRERPAGEAAALVKLSRDLALIANHEELLRRAVAKARELVAAERAALYLPDVDGTLAQRAADGDDTADRPARLAAARLAREGRTTVAADDGDGGRRLCLPVVVDGQALGALCLERAGDPFGADEARRAAAFLAEAAAAMEYAFLYQRMANAAKGNAAETLSAAARGKVEAARAYLDEHFRDDLSREGLAASLDLHPDTLSRIFRQHTGRRMSDYLNELRVREAARLLRASGDTIIAVAFAVGFESVPTFNRVFKQIMKTTPQAWREGDRAAIRKS